MYNIPGTSARVLAWEWTRYAGEDAVCFFYGLTQSKIYATKEHIYGDRYEKVLKSSMARKLTETLRNAVFRSVRLHGGIERRALAKTTGMARQTVDRIVAELLERGDVVVRTFARQPRGRRPAVLGINPDRFLGAGMVVDGGTMTAVVCDYEGRRLSCTRTPCAGNGGSAAAVREMIEVVRSGVCAARRRGHVCAAGIALPGFIDSARGRCILSADLGLRDVALGDILSATVGVPVRLEDITRAYAAAAVRFVPRSAYVKDFLYVHAGDGVGLGIVQDGRVYYGPTGISGEIGHMSVDARNGAAVCSCGNRGCIESVASTSAIVREVNGTKSRGAGRVRVYGGFAEVSAAAHAGDAVCRHAIARAIDCLGKGIANTINVLGIPHVIVGGELVRDDGEIRSTLLSAAIRRRVVNVLSGAVQVSVSRWDPADAARSAAVLAVDRYLEDTHR
jgi:N-acetylglucosamine repressor